MKRLLTTSPGSATPDLVVAYDPDTGNSELVLITHVVPTMEVQTVVDYGYRRSGSAWGDELSRFSDLDPLS